MPLTRALTQAEIDFIIKAKEEGLPNRTIAEKLGRSLRCVQKYSKQYNDKKAEVARKAASIPDPEQPKRFRDRQRQNTLARLVETRDILRAQMLSAEPRNIAQITKEYRATLAQIEELEQLEQKQVPKREGDASVSGGAKVFKLVAG